MTPAIAIVGAGPCGLTLARLLECKGIDYAVYERDGNEHVRGMAGSLDIRAESGQRAIREAGLTDQFMKHARYEDTRFALADKFGKMHLEVAQIRDAPEIGRSELRQVLLDSIPKDKVKWGHSLVEAKLDENNRPVLRFSNGALVSGCKLVVGTDGAWSKVRLLITQAKPQYSGKTYIESKIGLDNPLYESTAAKAGSGIWLTIGSGKQVLTQRQGDGSYRVYFANEVPENFFNSGAVNLGDVEGTRRLLLSDGFFADWSEQYTELIRHSTDFRAWPLYSLSKEDLSWSSTPGVTLAGDAAHLSLVSGEGANNALVDSLELASKIAEYGVADLDRAVREYEADMLPRGIAQIVKANAMTAPAYGEGPEGLLAALKASQEKAE